MALVHPEKTKKRGKWLWRGITQLIYIYDLRGLIRTVTDPTDNATTPVIKP